MSKQYAVIGYISGPSAHSGKFLGYAGCDSASGGYPYNAGTTRPEFHHNLSFPKTLIDYIKKGELRELTDGGTYITSDASIFDDEYRKITGLQQYTDRSIRICIVEYDFSNPIKPKAKVIESITVEYCIAESYKTRDKAYYRVVCSMKSPQE